MTKCGVHENQDPEMGRNSMLSPGRLRRYCDKYVRKLKGGSLEECGGRDLAGATPAEPPVRGTLPS
jgi:hypothetical protein